MTNILYKHNEYKLDLMQNLMCDCHLIAKGIQCFYSSFRIHIIRQCYFDFERLEYFNYVRLSVGIIDRFLWLLEIPLECSDI